MKTIKTLLKGNQQPKIVKSLIDEARGVRDALSQSVEINQAIIDEAEEAIKRRSEELDQFIKRKRQYQEACQKEIDEALDAIMILNTVGAKGDNQCELQSS